MTESLLEEYAFGVETIGDVTVATIRPPGFVAAGSRAWLELADSAGPVVFSFRHVAPYFASDLLFKLARLRAHMRIGRPGAELLLADLKPGHWEIFGIVDPTQNMFRVFSSLPQAIDACGASGAGP